MRAHPQIFAHGAVRRPGRTLAGAVVLTAAASAMLVLTTSACYHPIPTLDYDPTRERHVYVIVMPATLEVSNRAWSDVNIDLVMHGQTTRLTTMMASRTQSFKIPVGGQDAGGGLRLLVSRLGGRDAFVSDPLWLESGKVVKLTIQDDLRQSSVGVW